MTGKKAVFIGDIFRTHTSLKGGQFGGSTSKLAQLLFGSLAAAGYTTKTIIEDHMAPEIMGLYCSVFGDMNNVHIWAMRSQIVGPSLEAFYEGALDGVDLVIGFELPESLYAWCSARNIMVIDFAFHFVRFEADYRMMVRSNADRVTALLKTIRHNPDSLDVLSTLSGLPALPDMDARDEISLFIMQTRFDRSKFNGHGGLVDDLDLLRVHDIKVDYYKPHPMEHRPELELHLRRSGAQRFPFNGSIYAFLARYGHKTRVITVSSGLAAEADMLGVRSWRMLAGFPWVVDGHETYSAAKPMVAGQFIPVDHRVFGRDFVAAMLTGAAWSPGAPSATKFSLKEFWNVKWS